MALNGTFNTISVISWYRHSQYTKQGRIQGGGGGAHPARPPPPPKIGKNMIFFGVKSWFFTRNTPKLFSPPSARRNIFKCAPPLTLNPGSAPAKRIMCEKNIKYRSVYSLFLQELNRPIDEYDMLRKKSSISKYPHYYQWLKFYLFYDIKCYVYLNILITITG